MGKKKGNRSSNGAGAAGGSSSSGGGKTFCGESAAAVQGSAGSSIEILEEPWTRNPSRGQDVVRPTAAVEKAMAVNIANALVEQNIQPSSSKLREVIPTVDVPSVVEQMRAERERYIQSLQKPPVDAESRYHDLARYGMFLKEVRERLADEHKKATQKAMVAKALADRSRGEREWSVRSKGLERANALIKKLSDAATNHLNKHVAELQASPLFIRAMAETQARDMVRPGWDCSWLPDVSANSDACASNGANDGLKQVEEGISFEDLLALEKSNIS
jgi:hypothetical protein